MLIYKASGDRNFPERISSLAGWLGGEDKNKISPILLTIMTTINLDSWLADTIGNPARRAAVRALVDSLDDFRACELEDLEETLVLVG